LHLPNRALRTKPKQFRFSEHRMFSERNCGKFLAPNKFKIIENRHRCSAGPFIGSPTAYH
jgi:hypothetical protein